MEIIRDYLTHLKLIVNGENKKTFKRWHLPKSIKQFEYVNFVGKQDLVVYKFQHIYIKGRHIARYTNNGRWLFSAEGNTFWYACSELSRELAKYGHLPSP